jgi:ferric-dicitrate binding protein FerR (iron transport regulator)
MENFETFDPVARLLQHAGRRTVPPSDMVERIRRQVHAAWRAELSRKRRSRNLAVAASMLTLTLGGWWATQPRDTQPPTIVASVERSPAGLSIHSAGHTNARGDEHPGAGTLVAVGDRLDTGPGGGALLRVAGVGASQASLRLAPDTHLVWQAPGRLHLLGGQVYLDTGVDGQGGDSVLAIEAGGARIEHVGTRFSVALSGDILDVKVRDGTVRINAAGGVSLLESGESGRLDRAGSGVPQIERLRVDTSGEDWSWVDALAPVLNIDEQSLWSVLQRAAHEGGLQLRFESPELVREARETVLHGPALTMSPRQALDAILVTSGFEAVPEDDRRHLLVRRL